MKKKVLAIVAVVVAAVAFCLCLRSTAKVEPREGMPRRKTSDADRHDMKQFINENKILLCCVK